MTMSLIQIQRCQCSHWKDIVRDTNNVSVQIHPIEYDNLTVLEPVIDEMEELGLWLMYEMR